MADAFRRILYPTFVATIIATLWAMAHANAMTEKAFSRRSWPALSPELYQVINESDDADHEEEPTAAIPIDEF